MRSQKTGAAKTQEIKEVAQRVESILEVIGETPILRLQRLPVEASAEVWVKLDSIREGASRIEQRLRWSKPQKPQEHSSPGIRSSSRQAAIWGSVWLRSPRLKDIAASL